MKKYPPFSLLLLLTLILLAAGSLLADTKICAVCGQPITGGTFVEVEGKAYHSEHFCCARCGQPIGDAPYWTVEGHYYDSTCYVNHVAARCTYCGEPITEEWITDDSGAYHTTCYYEHVAPRCFVCNKAIDGRYFVDEFGQTVCDACNSKILHCHSCSRMISPDAAAVQRYDDGRVMCSVCRESAVMKLDEARKMMEEVRRDLKAEGIDVKGGVDLQLVSQPELARHSNWLNEDRLGVTEFTKTPAPGIIGVFASNKDFRIHVLYGLPRVQLRKVLAHELMHVWLFKNGPPDHERQLCEGSCEYASFLVLSRNPSDESRFYVNRLMDNPDPVYGEGFRKVSALVNRIGKENWLEHLREHSHAPW